MPDTARVFITGDASSIKKAMEEAGLYAEAASAKIAKASKTTESGFLSMSGAGKKAATELESSTGRMGSALGGLATSGNLAIAGIVGVGVAVAGIKKSAATFEEIGKTVLKVHELTGLSVKSASQYAAVAKVNDINVKGLMMSFVTLSKNVQAVTNAHDGLTKSAHTQENAFKLLGLPLKDVVGAHGNLNKLLPEVVSKFEHLAGSTSKAAIAQALFGRGAKELVPLMHTGALGLKEQLEEAEKYGAAVGNMSSNEFKKFIKAQEEAKYALLGLEMTIGQKVAPALSSLISGFASVVKSIKDGSGTIGKAAHVIGVVFSAMWKETEFAWKIQDQVIGAFVSAVGSAAGAVGKAVGVIVAGFKGLASGVSDAIKAAVNAVKGFFNDFYDIGKYLISGLVKGIEAGAEAVGNAVKAIGEGALGIAKHVFGVNSPSKVFHGIGLNITEGLRDGLIEGQKHVQTGVTAMLAPVHASTAGLRAAVATSNPSSVQQQIVAYFVGKGLTPAQAAGIAGNAGQESSYDPNAPGGGLFQTIGGRGVPQGSSVQAQLESAWREMNARGEVGAIKRAGSPQEAARVFESLFERAGIPALSNRERYAAEAFAGYHGGTGAVSGGTASPAATPQAKPWMPGAHERTSLAAAALVAARAHRAVAALETSSTSGDELQQLQQSRWGASPADLASPGGQATARARAEKTLSTDKAKRRVYGKELAALHREAAGFQKAIVAYQKAARHVHDPKQKREVLDKAAAFGAKLEQAQAAAAALGGKIYAAETSIIEAHAALAALPGQEAQAEGEAQSNDLNAYQSANTKVDAEVRAGLKTEAQGKAAKEANARKAQGGGYGGLSAEGMLQVMGDLVEAMKENTTATESNTAAAEAQKGLNEQQLVAGKIAEVESGSLAKSLADVISGQIGGKASTSRLGSVGAGSAARY